MQKLIFNWSISLLAIGLFSSITTVASELTIPNEFSSGEVTSASDMNANFTAIKAAVDDIYVRIEEGMQAQSRAVFVGFSSDVVAGDDCLGAVQLACHNISPESHMCSDYELTVAPYNPDAPIPDGRAWISVETGSRSGDYNQQSNRIESCMSSMGYFIENGSLTPSPSLEQTLPVACCK